MNFIYKNFFILIIVIALYFLMFPNFSYANDSFPRKANYFLKWSLTNQEAIKLSKWDLLILDMENQVKNPDIIRKIKRLNPNIKILVYITPQEIIKNYNSSSSALRQKLGRGISDEWYLKNSKGKILSYWTGTNMLNITSNCPLVHGKKLNDYVSDFVVNNLLSSGLWDGVFYDNAWETMEWAFGSDIDTNNDGRKDFNPNIYWQEGVKDLYIKTRKKIGKKIILVGNATTDIYKNELDGNMLENFPLDNWERSMSIYKKNQDQLNNFNIINLNTNNTGDFRNYKNFRYGLTSSMLEDGYFSFDHGDQDHGQTWWYDEYDVDLGNSISKATSKNNYKIYKEDVWKRNFKNGVSIVNSTNKKQTIDLGGEYEKIHGTQDAKINNGEIVSKVSVAGEDGLLLLKTFETLNDLVFTNGAFLRFFRNDGSRVRNGFFVFEDGEKGGVQIIHTDLDNNGKRDLVIARRNKIMAWRDDGQLYLKVYPYGGRYKGNLVLAVGDLNGDRKKEIYVAPTEGYAEPIRVYTRHGRKMRKDFYPFGTDYTGGYTLAIGDTDPIINSNQLFIGKLSGSSTVSVFSYRFKQLQKWNAFESWFTGGVYVASGDVDGDGIDEVVVGKGKGGKPLIKIFDISGKLKYPEFSAYSSFGNPGVDVRVVDVDFDGKEDIVSISEGVF